MKRIILILCLISTLNLVYSQENRGKFDYKLGTGLLVAGKGNIVFCVENELNYKISQYVSSSAYIDLGREVGIAEVLDRMQIGINVFASPFKNARRNVFKIGLGLGVINEAIIDPIRIRNDEYNKILYDVTKETNGVASLIIENEYWLNSRFSIGGKLYGAVKFNKGGSMVGLMAKLGISL